jgi:hypothetical protein
LTLFRPGPLKSNSMVAAEMLGRRVKGNLVRLRLLASVGSGVVASSLSLSLSMLRFPPVNDILGSIQVKLWINQLTLYPFHKLLRLSKAAAQNPREQCERVRLHRIQQLCPLISSNFFQLSVFGPNPDRSLSINSVSTHTSHHRAILVPYILPPLHLGIPYPPTPSCAYAPQ